MIFESEIPETPQGLLDYMRFGKAELKKVRKKNENLEDMITECGQRLTKLGYFYDIGNQQWKNGK